MNEQLAQFLRALSRLLGWIYTLSWSASFYPQPIANWKRKTTSGTSVDFPFLNVVGFTCYTVSTASLLCSSTIRREYAERHPYAPLPTVRANDLVYNIHALTLVVLTYSQFYPRIWGFSATAYQRIGRPTLFITTLCFLGIFSAALIILLQGDNPKNSSHHWMWLDLIYTIGYVKLVLTFIKYIPQVLLNYRRKSTAGWTISQILLDVLGGVTSILQLVIDANMQNNWRDAIDNPIKLGLGYISIGFDLVFIVQHYILYRGQAVKNETHADSHETRPLLRSED